MPDTNLPAIQSGGKALAVIPQSLDEINRLASSIARSGMAPRSYLRDEKRPDQGFSEEKIAVGILHGLEVGFTPMMALQSIAVVNGMPTIWGDGALAKVLDSGLCEEHNEFFEDGTPIKREGANRGETVEVPNLVAVCVFKRKGRAKEIRREFSYEDAMKAGLLSKNTYQGYLKRMLQMRARALGMRDTFADVLRGLHIREEVDGMTPDQPAAEAPPRPKREDYTAPTDAIEVDVAEAESDEAATDEEPKPDEFDPVLFEASFLSLVERCTQASEIQPILDQNHDDLHRLDREKMEELIRKANHKATGFEQAQKPKSRKIVLGKGAGADAFAAALDTALRASTSQDEMRAIIADNVKGLEKLPANLRADLNRTEDETWQRFNETTPLSAAE